MFTGMFVYLCWYVHYFWEVIDERIEDIGLFIICPLSQETNCINHLVRDTYKRWSWSEGIIKSTRQYSEHHIEHVAVPQHVTYLLCVHPLTRVAGGHPQNDLNAVNGSLSGGEDWVSTAGDHLTQ